VIHDEFPGVALHNVAETTTAPWNPDGHRLRRTPAALGRALNVDARERMGHPTNCELRFVPETDEATVRVTVSAQARTVLHPFWGDFQGEEPVEFGPVPKTIELSVPERIGELDDRVETGAFDPHVCRLRFDAWEPVAVHDVAGACRPPTDDELPDHRYLAHGTSITEGAAASAAHLTYVSRVARRLGVDPINLGASGSAFCEPAMAEYIGDRDDWDVATLALSVNMANRGFTEKQFDERVQNFVRTVAEAHPEKPVVCVTLFSYHEDLVQDGDRERAAAFRSSLRSAVDRCETENVHLVEGPDLMDATGLTTDLLHPGDVGMEAIGAGLADAVGPLLD
jgi:lysophospholipase L1-like esterase